MDRYFDESGAVRLLTGTSRGRRVQRWRTLERWNPSALCLARSIILSLTNVEGRTTIDTVTLLGAPGHIVGVHKRVAHVSECIVHCLKVLERVDVSTWSRCS